MSRDAIAVAWTGASGAPYGLRLLEQLLLAERTVYLMISPAALTVLEVESGITLPADAEGQRTALLQRLGAESGRLSVFGRDDWMAPVASGSNAPAAMVVCPCSGGTLSALASGASNNLIERAADVMLKERRPLVIVPREMPLSPIHLENMLKLSRLGVTVMPASPGFYHKPQGLDDLVDFVVARILDQLAIEHRLMGRWGE